MERDMEELMAGLFGSMLAPGAGGGAAGAPAAPEDPRLRQAGYSGISGPEVALARLMPFLMGVRYPNIGGPQGPGRDAMTAIGGPNAAPGAQSGQAVNQPGPSTYAVGAMPGQGPVSGPGAAGRGAGPPAGRGPSHNENGLARLLRVGR